MKKYHLIFCLFGFFLTCTPAFSQISLKLNRGDKLTNNPLLEVSIVGAKDAKQMCVSEDPGFQGAEWQPFSSNFQFRLDSLEGTHYVFVKVRPENGKPSEAVAQKIILDTRPPRHGFFSVVGGTYVTSPEGIALEIFAKDAAEMIISNRPDFKNAHWIGYRTRLLWRIPEGEGKKEIYLKFRDKAKNETATLRQAVVLDKTPPQNGSLRILIDSSKIDPDTKVRISRQNKAQIDLKIFAEDAKYMILSNNSSFFGRKWEYYKDFIENWEISSRKDGIYRVYVKFKDLAQNESGIYADTLIIDTAPPYGCKIRIGEGKKRTNQHILPLTLRAIEAHEMRLSLDSAFTKSDWEKFRPQRPFTLPEKDGFYTLYAVFRDFVGNVSEVVKTTIELDKTPPQDDTVRIISALPYTLEDHIRVKLKAKDAVQMQLSMQADFSDTPWRSYTTAPQKVRLSANLGPQVVYARFRDHTGNISKPCSDTILVANKPALCRIDVSGKKRFCTAKNKQLSLSISAVNASEMQISESPKFEQAAWQPYQTEKKITLSEDDGEKTIFARFRNDYGVQSPTVQTRVILDRSVPDGKLLLNGGNFVSMQSLINVKLEASGADFMKIGFSPDLSDVFWQNYKENHTLDLGVEKGSRTIYAQLKDAAGNESPIFSDSVNYAILPVRNGIRIDGGAKYTNHPEGRVNLQLDSRHAVAMRIGNSPDFQGVSWEDFQPSKAWQLDNSEGKKRVYVQYKSQTDTKSAVYADSIVLDRVPPTASLSLQLNAQSKQNPVLEVLPRAKGAAYMQISDSAVFDHAYWEVYQEKPVLRRFFRRGKKIIYARFRDEAGNISTVVSDTAVLEINPYFADFQIDRGKKQTTNQDKKVTLAISCRAAEQMMISQHPKFAGAKWEAYRTEKKWVLAGEDGEKTIYIKFRSSTHTESLPLSRKILLDRTPPSNLAISVDGGAESTFNAYVEVAVKADGAVGMQLSTHKNFEGATWQAYSPHPFRLDLPVKGGLHTVYARFKDSQGNVSKIISDDILLEVRPLETAFLINRGALYTNNRQGKVMLNFQGRYVAEILVSNAADFSGAHWQSYQENLSWTLSAGDGEKQVFVRFRSKTKTESAPVSQKIVLDRQPPQQGDLRLSQDAQTMWGRIKVEAKAEGAAQMQISEDKSFAQLRWLPFTDLPQHFQLSGGDGEKTVYARFRDVAGNVSAVVRKSYRLDTTPPQAVHLLLNGGKTYINQIQVPVKLLAEDAAQMRLASRPEAFTDTLAWQPYRSDFSWEIAPHLGTQRVFAQVRDEAGNTSHPVNASVLLDTLPPTNAAFYIAEGTHCAHPTKTVNLVLSASGAAQMIVGNSSDFSDGVWETFKRQKKWLLGGEDGRKTVYVQFADEAGNASELLEQEIVLDRTAPKGEIMVNEGAKITNNPAVLLQCNISDAAETILSTHRKFSGAKWQPFAPEQTFLLPARNGKKVIYARFRDSLRNESETYTAEILLDMQPPSPKSVQVNLPPEAGKDNLLQVEQQQVTLYFVAKDAAFIRLANSEEALKNTDWQAFFVERGKNWMKIAHELTPLDLQAAAEGRNPTWKAKEVGIQGQLKKVYYQLKDEAGNESGVFTKEIMLYAPKPMEVFIWKWQ